MGFLSGAFGKLMAGKYLRTLQFKATMVQSRLRQTTREIGRLDKMFSSREKQIKTGIAQQQQAYMYEANLLLKGMCEGGPTNDTQVTSTNYAAYSAQQQKVQAWAAMANTYWEQMFEMEKESLLQPLKDLEEDLQSEKDNLESQIKIAQAEYDAKKEEEKAGAKTLAPDYTGQG